MPSQNALPYTDLASGHPLASRKGVWHPRLPRIGPCWLLFRNVLTLSQSLNQAKLYLSASQRCQVWLNGQLLAAGPARSDRETWPYMTIELPALSAGAHCLAIEVVHYGSHAGKGQIGGPGFLLSTSDSPLLSQWSSDDPAWRCRHDESRAVWTDYPESPLKGHRGIGTGQQLDGAKHPWGWLLAAYDDSTWVQPLEISETHNNPWGNRPFGCHLVAQSIPQMTHEPFPWQRILQDNNLSSATSWTIPARTTSTLIADAGWLVTAYPLLTWSNSLGTKITIRSCEAPFSQALDKLPRDIESFENVILTGQEDCIFCGAETGSWTPEWIRAIRYLVVLIETADSPCTIDGLKLFHSTFPLQPSLVVELGNQRPWADLIRVNRQTAASCSHETFFDCPAWEQAQFPGDGRIQARHHYMVGNDDRLALKAISDCAASRTPSGLLRSHWPSSFEQVISTYSLQWIGMLHDHWWQFASSEKIAPFMSTARGIIDYFLNRQAADGLIGRIDEAPFIDWAFPAGCAPQDDDGGSSLITAMVAETCTMLAELEMVAGYPEISARWQGAASSLRDGVMLCWDENRQLLRSTRKGNHFCLHTQVQAVLAGCWTKQDGAAVLKRARNDPQCVGLNTFYYRAHLAEALRRSGQTAAVYRLLDDWFAFLHSGIETWPETDNPKARSDCHAWGCSPEIEIVQSLFGLRPQSPGWQTIICAPLWSKLHGGGSIRHQSPAGLFRLDLRPARDSLHFTVENPVPCQWFDDSNEDGVWLDPGRHQGTIGLTPQHTDRE